MTVRLRPRSRLGPALRRVHVPFGPLALSAVAHAALAAVLVAAALLWPAQKTKTYIVNLVPAVPAVGAPHGRPKPADLPPRAATPPPRPETPPARELPPVPRELPPAPRELPPAPRELPPTRNRELPPPSRESAALPDRPLPPRPAALPRAGDKELPTVPRAASTQRPTPSLAPAKEVAVPSPPPPPAPALGQAAGSAQGAGAVTLNVSDFPYAWYIQAIHRKIQERWEGRAIQGHQPEVIFEIARDGQLKRVAIGKSSGNPAYDQIAMRAIAEANPFPRLPDGFDKSVLTIGLQFVYDPTTR
ncbi:MAG TPA: energy transducer TonB [Methylomirabilota bacterium]|nr:energy transducer TonB [Methylomirabilota bacterium]